MAWLQEILAQDAYRLILNHLVSQFIAMSITILLLPGLRISSIFGTIWILCGISLLNAFLWDASLFFSVPTSMSVYALELVVVNGVFFWLMVKLLPGIEIDGIISAFIAPIIFSICSIVLRQALLGIDWVVIATVIFEYLTQLKNHFIPPKSGSM